MQFLYHERAKDELIKLEKEEARHIKVRREQNKSLFYFRNLEDDFLYTYLSMDEKKIHFKLVKKEEKPSKSPSFSLALAMIEPKQIEQVLIYLNELNCKVLYLIYTKYSQKHFKLDENRIKKILINSCKQCNRSKILEIKIFYKLSDFLASFPDTIAIDFSGKDMSLDTKSLYFIGPEGGFSKDELALFKNIKKLQTSNILRSKTAAIAIASLMSV